MNTTPRLARLLIPQNLFEELLRHAQSESPNECCGLLAGNGNGEVTHRYPLVNELASPTEFLSEPRSMFAAVKDMRARGTEVLAVYHSHPASPPVPSRTDLERNYSEQVVNLIVGLAGAEPDVRAWWLTAEAFRPAEWQLIKSSPQRHKDHTKETQRGTS